MSVHWEAQEVQARSQLGDGHPRAGAMRSGRHPSATRRGRNSDRRTWFSDGSFAAEAARGDGFSECKIRILTETARVLKFE